MNENYFKEYYQRNKARLKKQSSAYYQANRESILESRRRKNEENPDAARLYWQDYYKKNKLKLKARREIAKERKENGDV